MNKPVNIYSAVVFDLNPRIKEYIDSLNSAGQIDLDDNGYPYLVSVNKEGSNFVVQIVRNGTLENFIINTRKRKDPIVSWDPTDGFVRQTSRRVISIDQGDDAKRGERQKRTVEAFERIVNQILKD